MAEPHLPTDCRGVETDDCRLRGNGGSDALDTAESPEEDPAEEQRDDDEEHDGDDGDCTAVGVGPTTRRSVVVSGVCVRLPRRVAAVRHEASGSVLLLESLVREDSCAGAHTDERPERVSGFRVYGRP